MATFYLTALSENEFVRILDAGSKETTGYIPKGWYPRYNPTLDVPLFEIVPVNTTIDSRSISFQDSEFDWESCEPSFCLPNAPISEKLQMLGSLLDKSPAKTANYNTVSVENFNSIDTSIPAGTAHKIQIFCIQGSSIISDGAKTIRITAPESFIVEGTTKIGTTIGIDNTSYGANVNVILTT